MTFHIRFSENMKKQLPEPRLVFDTRDKAEDYGIRIYGSGSHNKNYGWYIEEFRKPESIERMW